jgi:tRNA G18 (ribose-2'-O)-methylase SpoU
MRGYFGIGVENLSKPGNAGNLFRSAQAFGAGFIFSVSGSYTRGRGAYSDTSRSVTQVPYYDFPSVAEMKIPERCRLVGIELLDEAQDLPTFKHPIRAAYVLGPERGSLSPEMVEACEYVVKIPTAFCINVATAGAIVMYDRVLSLGKFGDRAVFSRNPGEPPKPHVQGGQKVRRRAVKSAGN